MSEPNDIKILTNNRRARYLYHLSDYLETGMVLTGSEVKSAREGKIQLSDAYGTLRGRELWLVNAHISPYGPANRENHDPVRPRKLLAHRPEIDRLGAKTREKGLTLIPTRIYLKKGRVKCELALAKGKKLHDKRDAERKRESEKEARSAIRGHLG
ncbi:MAG: SsrA-binding protein SmpB [Bryobacterales bacterium]|nr:SsrA-binding protein SmpB [Bryobacterales bacterium]